MIHTNKIDVSSTFELEKGNKYYIGYKDGEFVRPLCIILPHVSGFIIYFDGSRKSMSLLSKDGEMIKKYNKIWKK